MDWAARDEASADILSVATGKVLSVLKADELLAAHDAVQPPVPLASTGFPELESLTGGMVPGRVWILVGVPGEGRTTLLTQWAAAIASRPDQLVHLVTPRETPQRIAARLLSLTGLVPLHHLSAAEARASRHDRLLQARDQVRDLALCLYARGDDTYVPEVHPVAGTRTPTALVIDDADLCGGVDPAFVSECAEAGMFVLLSLPRHLVTTSTEARGGSRSRLGTSLRRDSGDPASRTAKGRGKTGGGRS